MLRTLERTFKHVVAALLRRVVGSRPAALTPNSVFNRILVIRQHNQLGDMLCVVPLLRALRRKFPDAYIALMASPINYEIMLNNRHINSVIKYDKSEFLGRGLAGWRNIAAWVRRLREEKFDLALVPSTVSTSFTSDLFAYLSGAGVRIGAKSLNGSENPSGFFFTNPVHLDWNENPGRHQTLRNLDVAKEVGLHEVDLTLEVGFSEDEATNINQLKKNGLDGGTVVIAYHSGAGKVRNMWDALCFAEVANALSEEYRAGALIICGPMDEEPVAVMIKGLRVRYTLVSGKPIREVAAILSTVSLVITNDTGIMHVAAGVGVPVLSLFGPTDPQQWAPLGIGNRYIRGNGGNINAITVQEVLKIARAMLTMKRVQS